MGTKNAKKVIENLGEKCQRCGEVGEDRRTLHHECFYQMKELSIPFTESEVFSIDRSNLKRTKKKIHVTVRTYDPILKKLSKPRKNTLYTNVIRAQGVVSPRTQYTLRVCKDCRADWMSAIQNWFKSTAWAHDRLPCHSGIFVRRNGANVEITQEEWDRENPGREAVKAIL